MDFFGEQRRRTRRSLLLYGLFLSIVLLHVAVALGLMALLMTLFTDGIYYWVLVAVTLWTLLSFVIGSYLEYRRLRGGGRAIAQRVGAVRLFIDRSQSAWEHSQGVAHRHDDVSKVRFSAHQIAVREARDFPSVYRRYYECAEQLSIAAGLSMPILYVLPEEQGINGFVAGRHPQDTVLVLTQGALDKLSDEALFGLIGHEYGHILHGDAKFNLHLMVVLAGLQLLYDWSDPIDNLSTRYRSQSNYFEQALAQKSAIPQREIDTQARHTEAQTAAFTTHSEWVNYWQQQSLQQQATAKRQSRWLLVNSTASREAPRSIGTLLLHGLSFSSMASAQLIKHSFNRERELLADATSVQLTRSPAILATLKAIHQDSLGSRLTGIADINGLSHFFFASSGADLSDVSWFATHPSLAERMNAINANEYQQFADQVSKQQQLNQQKIKEIYEQRRLGDWGTLQKNSLSKSKLSTKPAIQSSKTEPVIENVMKDSESVFSENKDGFDSSTDEGLAFTVEKDIIIDGRLQVNKTDLDCIEIKPWLAKPNSDLPANGLISVSAIDQVSLPHYVLNHIHHLLGAVALIESVMLCHQYQQLSTTNTYGLDEIWCTKITNDIESIPSLIKGSKLLPHTIDAKLLDSVATLDRRLDSALISVALTHLSRHDLSSTALSQLHQQSTDSHTHQSHEHYKQQKHSRSMLLRYQSGLLQLLRSQLNNDLTQAIDAESSNFLKKTIPKIDSHNNQHSLVLSLWQAVHLKQLLPVLSSILGAESQKETPLDKKEASYQQILQSGLINICGQLDPSKQLSKNTAPAEQMMLTLFAYRLGINITSQLTVDYERGIVDLRRYGRLIDIDLSPIDDANLQWLLLTAQSLNSVQLLAIIEPLSIDKFATYMKIATEKLSSNTVASTKMHALNSQQLSTLQPQQIAYNHPKKPNYRLWLNTLHTVMLHDTIVSQDEYDSLTLLAEYWMGVRQLFD